MSHQVISHQTRPYQNLEKKAKSTKEECKEDESPQIEYQRKDEFCSNQASVASAQENIKSSSVHKEVINEQYKNKIFVVLSKSY